MHQLKRVCTDSFLERMRWRLTAMPKVTALLFTSDLALANAVREVIDSVSQLQLEVVGTIEQASAHLHRSDLGLLILHLGRRESDAVEVARILENGGLRCRH